MLDFQMVKGDSKLPFWWYCLCAAVENTLSWNCVLPKLASSILANMVLQKYTIVPAQLLAQATQELSQAKKSLQI